MKAESKPIYSLFVLDGRIRNRTLASQYSHLSTQSYEFHRSLNHVTISSVTLYWWRNALKRDEDTSLVLTEQISHKINSQKEKKSVILKALSIFKCLANSSNMELTKLLL